MAVLYRKYRSQTFSEIVGQKHIIQTLKNQVKTGNISHAYLFTGGRGVGKTSVARIMAKAVNCIHPQEGEPDGTCTICLQIANNTFLDLVEIDAASNTGVDNIRDLIEHVKFSPSSGAYKVFIIDEVHMLSKGAFNALLKTLEEPPKHAIFILATTEIHKVPATIISRTQRFDFQSISQPDLVRHIQFILKQEEVVLPEEIVELIADHAGGSGRDALSILDKVMTLGSHATVEECRKLLGVTDTRLSEELFGLIINGAAKEIPSFFDKLLENGTDIVIFNKDFLEFLRSRLIESVTGNSKNLNVQTTDLLFIIRLFLRSYKEIPSSPNSYVPLLLASIEGTLKKHVIPNTAHSVPVQSSVRQPLVREQPQISDASPIKPTVTEFAFTHVLEPTVAISLQEVAEEGIIGADETVSLADIEGKWTEVVQEIKKINSPLGILIRNSPIQKVAQGRVYFGVKYLFHKQNLENKKNMQIICEAIERITGKRLGVCASIIKDEQPHQNPVEILTDALSIFGGEVVE